MATTETKPETEATGDRVHDPIHRVSYSFRRDGDNLWVYTWLEDGGHLPEHFHPSLEEHWEVVEGAFGSSSTAPGATSCPRTARSRCVRTSDTSSRTRVASRPTSAPR